VARNLAIDHMRRKQPSSLDGLLNDDEAPLDVPATGQASAFDVTLRREQNEHIAAGMQHLPRNTVKRSCFVFRKACLSKRLLAWHECRWEL